jgi:tRNA(adenine34) deaminase
MHDPNDEKYMRLALAEARAALEHGDVPIGAVIVREGVVIARAHNQRELLQDPTAHAEVIALTQASSALGTWRLTGCALYVTLEPCVMCAGALVLARIDRLVYGAEDPKAGACGSLYRITEDERLNHRIVPTAGTLAAECGELLREFFRARRLKPPPPAGDEGDSGAAN